MKTAEQLKTAEEIILNLKDYIELAKFEPKLKVVANKENLAEMIESIIDMSKTNIKDL